MKVLHLLDHSLPVQSGYAYRSDAILNALVAHGIETVQMTGPKHDANLCAPAQGVTLDYLRSQRLVGEGVRAQISCITTMRRITREP